MKELRAYRERLRKAVLRIEDGKRPNQGFLADLNARLSAHPFRTAVVPRGKGMERGQAEGASVSDSLWAAVLDGTVKLSLDVDPARVRKCESCVVHFVDVSKKNARRWCSMRLCGNRLKVAAYQQRRRRASES